MDPNHKNEVLLGLCRKITIKAYERFSDIVKIFDMNSKSYVEGDFNSETKDTSCS